MPSVVGHQVRDSSRWWLAALCSETFSLVGCDAIRGRAAVFIGGRLLPLRVKESDPTVPSGIPIGARSSRRIFGVTGGQLCDRWPVVFQFVRLSSTLPEFHYRAKPLESEPVENELIRSA